MRTNSWEVTVAGLHGYGGGSVSGSEGPAGSLTIDVGLGEIHEFTGTLGGHLNLNKTGAGRQVLQVQVGNNVSIDVVQGRLELKGGFESGARTVMVRNGGSLLLSVGSPGNEIPEVRVETGGSLSFEGVGSGPLPIFKNMSGRESAFQLLHAFQPFTATTGDFIDGKTVSDVLHLNGLDGSVFVLQIGFDPEEFGGDFGDLRLGWLNGGEWVEAVLGNYGGGSEFQGFVSWDSLGTYGLGDWGIDLDSNTVWAVLNHNSDFAVIAVPEPSTNALLFAAGVIFVVWRRMRRV